MAAKSSLAPALPAGRAKRWTVGGICVVLAAITLAVFGQTIRHEFVNFDDDGYVYENAPVRHGLGLDGVGWAFTHTVKGNWHPVTVLSHMLDCQLYGLRAGGHHLTNVLLHTAAVLLLFGVLRGMTGTLWRSAGVAAVFAVHPLRVESVAWVAERKDMLSGVFFLLTLWAYGRYAQKRSRVESRESRGGNATLVLDPRRSTFDYALVLLFFSLGLMSKPMLVTLPFVLLLLDYWPLGRFDRAVEEPSVRAVCWSLIREKIPLLGLSAVGCAVALLAQKQALLPVSVAPIRLRIGNALVSCVAYLGQMIYPTGLAVFYPFPVAGLPGWKVALSVLLLAIITLGAVFWRRSRPYLIVGWLWYLGMLVPVIGLVQVGVQSRADRYTYLPQIGLYLLAAWLAADLCAGRQRRRLWLGTGAVLVISAMIVCARTQTSYWRDSESLWRHALAVTVDNDVANSNLGQVLLEKGQLEEAIGCYRRALEIRPDYGDAHNGLGFALFQEGRTDEAKSHFEEALRIQPASAGAHSNLGMVLLQAGRVDEAISHFRSALETDPGLPDAHNNLGAALVRKGLAPEAVVQYQRALELRPDYAGADNNLAWVLATCPQAAIRNGAKAVELAQRANQLAGGRNLVILRTLAAAYAESGRFPDAIQTAGLALQLAIAQANPAWTNALENEIRLYQTGRPFRDTIPGQ